MSAYVISEVKVLDENAANEYRRLAAESMTRYGGRYLVRGATPLVAEGALSDSRIVIVEFPSMDRIREWYASSEYSEALKFRDKALVRRLMFVDGKI
jgi:uncharacterized protein (DUF1330 family)